MSIFRCLYESVHFVSSARTFAASSSCAATRCAVPNIRDTLTMKAAGHENEIRMRGLPFVRMLQGDQEVNHKVRSMHTTVTRPTQHGKQKSSTRWTSAELSSAF